MNTSRKLLVTPMLNKQRKKEGKFQIFMRIYLDGKRSEISTKHYVLLKDWDNAANKVKNSDPTCYLINSTLDDIAKNINKHYLKLLVLEEDITIPNLKNLLMGKELKPLVKTIMETFDYHYLKFSEKAKAGLVSQKTATRYKITKNKVVAFMKHQYKVNDKPLPELRLGFITEFEHYLLTIDKLQSNTAHKYIKNLKTIMNMAVGLDWIPSNPFNQFKCSYTNPEREILTEEELDLILSKEFKIERLNEVRDVFIFCCYTGFAYSDIYQFEHDAVMLGLDKEYWLSTNRQKTGTRESVPLLPIPMEIIARYKKHPHCVKYNKLLPVNSNQKYNAYLHEIADLCGIKKHLTSHIARHTFATTVTLANGVPIETVSSMLGHTSIRTTQIYAKVIEKKVSEDMKLLKQKFQSKKTEVHLKIG
jgi:site-specific recombinase XerD